jgi:hypothetical protein
LTVCETFLKVSQEPKFDGFTWIGNNRGNLHANAHRGSGGVGAFLKNELFDFYDITTLDKSVEDILWIKVKCKTACFRRTPFHFLFQFP